MAPGRRHVAPVRNDRSFGVPFVHGMLHVRAIRTEAGRHHQTRRPCGSQHLALLKMKLPPKFVQGHIPHLFHRNGQVPASTLLLHDFQALVELVDLAIMMHISSVGRIFQLLSRLQGPRSRCVQTHHWHQRDHLRQLQAERHGLVQMIIAFAESPCEKLLYRPAQEISTFAFGHIIADLIDGVLQHLLDASRSLGRLRRILCDVLRNCPQIQHRTPIDVAHVCQQHMLFVAAA